MFGRKASLPTTANLSLPNMQSHTTKTWIAYLNHYLPLLQQNIRVNIQKSQEQQQKYYNK
ncbi:hypothetical protein CLU79DRAFT_687720, partial [Phycomyces nitens]